MTNTEKICNAMGNPAPNMDHETGIHYGVIPQNALDSWSLDDIFDNGIDLGYEGAMSEFRQACKSAADAVIQEYGTDNTDIEAILMPYLRDYVYERDLVELSNTLLEELRECPLQENDDLYNLIHGELQDRFSDMMSFACGESGPYRYESDGYIMETDSHGDLFITESSYYTLCNECSPCAPNAGYLTSDGSMKAYCLGHEWFEGDKAPYPVFRVDNDEEVLPHD